MPANDEMSTESASAPGTQVPVLRRPMDRRQFIRRAAVVGVGAAVMPGFLAACAAEATATPTATPTATSTATPVPPPTATPTPAATPTPVPSSFEGGVNPLFVVGNGITREDLMIPSGDAQIISYMARPVGEGPWPAVVVIHENRGLVAFLRDVADGLASSGFVGVAIDLASREGGTVQLGSGVGGALSRARDSGQGALDAVAVGDWLKSQAYVTNVGITGFCLGGDIVWQAAALSSNLDAAIPFYGRLTALEDASKITAAVYAVYGENDARVNATIEDTTAALNAAGTTWDSKIYADSPHAFMNHTRETRYSAAAPDAWADALAWFNQHLRG